jgi:hypothetical protein
MKKLLTLGVAFALSGCVAVPVGDYYGYAPSYPYAYYDGYYAPYYGYGYGFGYAPYYWGPPVVIGGAFFYRDFHGQRVWDGGHHWGGGGSGQWRGDGSGHRGGRGGGGRH